MVSAAARVGLQRARRRAPPSGQLLGRMMDVAVAPVGDPDDQVQGHGLARGSSPTAAMDYAPRLDIRDGGPVPL